VIWSQRGRPGRFPWRLRIGLCSSGPNPKGASGRHPWWKYATSSANSGSCCHRGRLSLAPTPPLPEAQGRHQPVCTVKRCRPRLLVHDETNPTAPVRLTRRPTKAVSLLCAPAPLRGNKFLLKEGRFRAEARRRRGPWHSAGSLLCAHFQADTSGGSWDWRDLTQSRKAAKPRRTRQQRGGVTLPVEACRL
jgi:hypothetical protein